MSSASELRLPLLLWLALAALWGCDEHRHQGTAVTPVNSHAGTFRLVQAYEVPLGFEIRRLALLPGDLLLGEGVGVVYLYGISADRGGLLWHRELGGRLLGKPAAVGGDGTYLYTVGPYTVGPNTVGPYTVGPNTVGPDTVGPDTVGPDTVGPDTVGPDTVGPNTVGPNTVGSTGDGDLVYVWCLDPYSGRLVRELPVEMSGRAAWYFYRNWLFVTASLGPPAVTAVDLAGWRVAWEWRPDLPPRGNAIMDLAAGSRLVAVVVDTAEFTTRIYLIERASGRLASTSGAIDEHVGSDLTTLGPVVYLRDSESRTIRALDLDSGRVLWHYEAEEKQRILSLHALGKATSGSLLVRASGPKGKPRALLLLDGRTGEVLWTVGEEGLSLGGPLSSTWREFSPGVIVAVSTLEDGCTIVALSASTGRLLWRHRAGSLCPEFGSDAYTSFRFVAGDYREVVLLRLYRFPRRVQLDPLRFPEPARLAFVAMDPTTGKTRAKIVDPAGVRGVGPGDVVSDGRMLYLHDGRRVLAYALPATP